MQGVGSYFALRPLKIPAPLSDSPSLGSSDTTLVLCESGTGVSLNQTKMPDPDGENLRSLEFSLSFDDRKMLATAV
jgi:hypothetical protein